jgi:hypothetical protein
MPLRPISNGPGVLRFPYRKRCTIWQLTSKPTGFTPPRNGPMVTPQLAWWCTMLSPGSDKSAELQKFAHCPPSRFNRAGHHSHGIWNQRLAARPRSVWMANCTKIAIPVLPSRVAEYPST